MMNDTLFEGVRTWMYRNARPLDLARFKYLFENGSRSDVLNTLLYYQNSDGGFGHGLEADTLNPESSPMNTWAATEILLEIEDSNLKNTIIADILRYLENCTYFKDGKWMGTIPSNNDCPHAPWWDYSEENLASWNWNPTACLAGFILYYADKNSKIYKKAEEIATKAYSWFMEQDKMESMHETFSFMRLYEYLKRSPVKNNFIDIAKFKEKLITQISRLIEKDPDVWETDYVCKPSFFISSTDSYIFKDNKDLVLLEVEFIRKSINDEGVWTPNWSWNQYEDDWAVCKKWWQGDIAIHNLLFIDMISKLK